MTSHHFSNFWNDTVGFHGGVLWSWGFSELQLEAVRQPHVSNGFVEGKTSINQLRKVFNEPFSALARVGPH